MSELSGGEHVRQQKVRALALEVAHEWLREEGEDPRAYRLEYEGIDEQTGNQTVYAVHSSDQGGSGEVLGSVEGKSRVLTIDLNRGAVVSALREQ